MPRPGQGTGGSSRSSSGHSYSSRSSSGHRISQSQPSFTSRPGSSQSSFSSSQRPASGSPFGTGYTNPRQSQPYYGSRRTYIPFPMFFNSSRRTPYVGPVNGTDPLNPMNGTPYTYSNNTYGGNRRRSSLGGTFFMILILFILFFILIGFMGCSSKQDDNAPASDYDRQKIANKTPYNANCIEDELGWFENIPQTEKDLKYFYDKTGIQPYIVLQKYDSSLKNDTQKAEYAKKYYDDHMANEDTFMYMYFAEPNDSEVGYMEAVNGKGIGSVMDANALDIFWNEIDTNWTSNQSTDELFVNAFNSTADKIMTKTTTSKDVAVKAMPVLAILAVGAVIIAYVVIRRKHERERAEETERILNTPLDPNGINPSGKVMPESGKDVTIMRSQDARQTVESEEDELLKRYGGK